MFFAILSAVFAFAIGFCLSTVFIKYNITEPNKHFEKYGYKCPQLAQFHEKLTEIINDYLNAFTYFDHKLYDTVHNVPNEEEMIFLKKVQSYQSLLDSYKNKRKLHTADSLILHSAFNNLERSYQALEKIATAATETETETNTEKETELDTAQDLNTAQYPITTNTTDSQLITIFDKLGRECIYEYQPSQSETEECV